MTTEMALGMAKRVIVDRGSYSPLRLRSTSI